LAEMDVIVIGGGSAGFIAAQRASQLGGKVLLVEKERIVKGVVVGMETKLQATGVRVVIGTAKLASPNQVEITFDNGTSEIVQAKKIIVATGSLARRYPIPGAYGSGVLTTKELLDLSELPKSLAIIGRSVTALELS
jgi:dihydrolipoamide dehydrogenase